MFNYFKQRRHRRRQRRNIDPAAQVGRAAGTMLSGLLVGVVKSLFKK
jgi:hypothetical protein